MKTIVFILCFYYWALDLHHHHGVQAGVTLLVEKALPGTLPNSTTPNTSTIVDVVEENKSTETITLKRDKDIPYLWRTDKDELVNIISASGGQSVLTLSNGLIKEKSDYSLQQKSPISSERNELNARERTGSSSNPSSYYSTASQPTSSRMARTFWPSFGGFDFMSSPFMMGGPPMGMMGGPPMGMMGGPPMGMMGPSPMGMMGPSPMMFGSGFGLGAPPTPPFMFGGGFTMF